MKLVSGAGVTALDLAASAVDFTPDTFVISFSAESIVLAVDLTTPAVVEQPTRNTSDTTLNVNRVVRLTGVMSFFIELYSLR